MTHRASDWVSFVVGLAIGLAVMLGLGALPFVLHSALYWSPA